MSRLDFISDHSKEKLKEIPQGVLDMTNLKMLFLEGNFLRDLPADFFWKLPNLVWLDLRNNLLESLPRSVANHENLENLLLTNNNLHKLPNELGLVPKLKALQIADNPLVYPMRQIIVEGTKVIKSYLRDQYEKMINRKIPTPDLENCSETVIRITDDSSSSELITEPKKPPRKKTLPEDVKQKLLDPKMLQPTLKVRQLSSATTSKRKRDAEPVKMVHKVDRTNSRILLRSTVNKLGARASSTQSTDRTLQEGWLHQIRILLNDQERILQQERNLRALSSWRVNQKLSTPKVFRDDATAVKVDPPYATDPKYAKIPTRDELATQLHKFFKENGIMVAQESRNRDLNIDKLINDLMQQLKEMEGAQAGSGSPRTEMEVAGRQIKTIINIQKKLLQLKSSNASTI